MVSNSEPARTQKLFTKLKKIARDTSSSASVENVHDLRTTARRIETLLSAHGLDRCGPTAKLAAQLKKLRRRAGKLRDVDVHIAALQGVRLENGDRDKRRVRDHLTTQRNKGERKLIRTLDTETSKALLKRMKRAESKLHAADDGLQNDYTSEALAKFKSLSDATPPLTDKTLHNFRIDCKRIRYLAEMSGESHNAQRVVSSLKAIQDAIGEWHDWLTLTDVATKVLPDRASPLVAALRTQTKSKFNQALRVTSDATRDLLALHSAITSPTLVQPRAEKPNRQNGNQQRAASGTAAITETMKVAA